MKKLVILVVFVLGYAFGSGWLEARALLPGAEEMSFAMNYFKILYDYDVKAVNFAKTAENISSTKKFSQFFKQQAEFVDKVKQDIETLEPPERYKESYIKVLKGLKNQKEYLVNIAKELDKGSSFDEAFAMHNWGFYEARKQVQCGIEEFKGILDEYNPVDQFKILSALGLSPEQLEQYAEDSEVVRSIQSGIDN